MSELVCEKNTKSSLLSESSCSILSEIFGSETKQHSFHTHSSAWQQIFLDWEITGLESSPHGHLGLCTAELCLGGALGIVLGCIARGDFPQSIGVYFLSHWDRKWISLRKVYADLQVKTCWTLQARQLCHLMENGKQSHLTRFICFWFNFIKII